MRFRTLCIVVAIFGMLAGCRGKSKHEEAIDRFATFAEGGLRAKGKETRALFSGCFRKGDSVTKYERALRSAKKGVVSGEGGAQQTAYTWRWTGRRNPNDDSLDEYAILTVVVGGYDKTILEVRHDYHPYDPAWSD